jgi:hypothetical protein
MKIKGVKEGERRDRKRKKGRCESGMIVVNMKIATEDEKQENGDIQNKKGKCDECSACAIPTAAVSHLHIVTTCTCSCHTYFAPTSLMQELRDLSCFPYGAIAGKSGTVRMTP